VLSRRLEIKAQVLGLLTSQMEWDKDVLPALLALPPGKSVNALFANLCHVDELVKWRAVTAMGAVTAKLARADMEAGRVVMRRLMWMLNDESGGIGWGAPEAMAEIMSRDAELAAEYAHMPVSYMRSEGSFLEYPLLQRGLLWAIARLAEARPELMRQSEAANYVEPYLDGADPWVRGMAARAIGRLGVERARQQLLRLMKDTAMFTCYIHPLLRTMQVGEAAAEAVRGLAGPVRVN